MHNLRSLLVMLIMLLCVYGQAMAQALPDSVVHQYQAAKTNTEKVNLLFNYMYVLQNDPLFFDKTAALINYLESVGDYRSRDIVQLGINDKLSKTGDYARSLASCLEILNRFEEQKDTSGILAAYRQLATAYYYAGDKGKDIVYGRKALRMAIDMNRADALPYITNNLSTSYSQSGIPDSALIYARLAVTYAKRSGHDDAATMALGTLSEAFIIAKQYDSALLFARESFMYDEIEVLSMSWTLNDLAQIFLETNKFDSAKHYAQKAARLSSANGFKDQLQRAYEYLSQSFDKTHKPDSAFRYLQLAVAIRDSLYSSDKTKHVQEILNQQQVRLLEIEQEKANFKNRIRTYSLMFGLTIFTVIAFILYRNNKQKQKANKVLEQALIDLKSTQSQLIQSEKMASLGELTAGIAHEIQNPLNFVNNFSDVNTELIDELKQELAAGNVQLATELANDIKDNEQKVNHHGKRADAIVKGMLQHSRASSNQKELTDINALCDEYLRLAYHGFRAKDKSFNAKVETTLDTNLPKVNVVPQDIGRVILNLINNAFYAVSERLRHFDKLSAQPDGHYEPTVTVSTKLVGDRIEIRVHDNGNGIPEKIKDKIFQPFFTTKPTGQGTGLGLSLSYDIVKAHGGELRVNTREGEGSEFSIQLPNI